MRSDLSIISDISFIVSSAYNMAATALCRVSFVSLTSLIVMGIWSALACLLSDSMSL